MLTFHRCINYGSYWQARCLVEGLRAMGQDAILLDHDSPAINWREWRCALHPDVTRRRARGDSARYAAKARRFFEAIEALPRSRRFPIEAPQQAGHFDAVIVGSDEVWSLRHPWYGGFPIFYGAGLETERLLSYAASFGSHHAGEGLAGDWGDRLRSFAALSVRDENSRRMVRHATGREPALVLDPCLQFPPRTDPRDARGSDYVALYGHAFPDWLMARVRSAARSRGLAIVSIGYRNAGADAQRLAAGPEEFVEIIAGAAAVVTNFFHGCVFALLCRRPFLTAPSDYRFNKVWDLLGELGAWDHLIAEDSEPARFAAGLAEPPSETVDGRIEALREASGEYLRRVLPS